MKEEKISVLMAVYNGEKYLKSAIDSILNQTYKNFELLILNDGSTDLSVSIIEEYTDARIKLYHNEINKGLIYTRNRLLQLATCDLIAIMDCDDISHPQRLEKQIVFLNNNSDVVLCGTFGEIIDENNIFLGIKVMPEKNKYLINIEMLFKNQFIHSSVVYYKEIAINMGGYSFINGCEDYGLFSKMSLKYRLANIDEFLVQYREHNQGISKTNFDTISKGEKQISINLFERFKLTETMENLSFNILKDRYETQDDFLVNSYFKELFYKNKYLNFYEPNFFWKVILKYWLNFAIINNSKKISKTILLFALKNNLSIPISKIKKLLKITFSLSN